jgi:putative toxin-antitoxin system antitoxin component (TIGR02293 family)
MTVGAKEIARVLGGERILRRRIRSLSELNAAVSEGLPRAALREAARHIAPTERESAELMHRVVPRGTLARRKTRLSRAESERLERYARLMALAELVWGNADDARAFLNESHPMLGDRIPIDLARTELGARMVEDLLLGLEYNVAV